MEDPERIIERSKVNLLSITSYLETFEHLAKLREAYNTKFNKNFETYNQNLIKLKDEAESDDGLFLFLLLWFTTEEIWRDTSLLFEFLKINRPTDYERLFKRCIEIDPDT